MRKKPYTTRELFEILTKRVFEKYPEIKEIVEYSLPGYIEELRSEQISPKITFDYGSNEGIYLDFNIYGLLADGPDERSANVRIGTIKTLHESDEAMFLMGKLSAALTIEMYDFIESNSMDFTWVGYRVVNGDNTFYIIVSDKDKLSDCLSKHYKSVDGIVITDLAERKTYRAKKDGDKIVLGEEVSEP